ncbi:MAG: sugar ABC transporter substrate-binding protein [Lachnospiraceae bacterium]|nr:sugar ABC transporter substrate-binding protein [Lachnospiraceae bacterium]
MKKKVVAMLLSLTMAAASLAGCGGTTDAGSASQQGTSKTSTASTEKKEEAQASSSEASSSDETLVIEIYDEAANYQGTQTGWFAKVVKDRFNIELNIIAPQVAGDAVYQTRTATGNLGDIVLLDPSHFNDCVAAGLIKDISGEIKDCTNLMEFNRQINALNEGIPGNNGAIYGIPCEMTNTSPTSFSDDVVYSSPMLRWDLYSGVGAPDIADLDGLLDTIKKIQDANPTNDAGDPAYGFSLWPDWDNNDGMIGIANVVQLTTWYGEKIKGSAILTKDDKFIPLTDKNGTYYKMLKFLYKANQMGIVDPDSGSQNWDAACAKMSAGQVYTFWYSWQVGFWNTPERLADGKGMIFIPVKDQLYYTTSDTYYGSGRVFGVGSGVEGEKYDRIMKFLDWYASPEGVTFQHDGIEGFNYELLPDGKFKLLNADALMANLPVPEEYGGAGYSDGNNAINQWIVSSISINPNSGEAYGNTHWSSYKEETATKTKNEWAARFGAAEPADWMKANNALLVRPSVSVSLPSEDADITVIRNQVGQEVKDASWRMIFAANENEFDSMWDTMTDNLNSLGFDQLYKFDVDKYTIELEAMQAAK